MGDNPTPRKTETKQFEINPGINDKIFGSEDQPRGTLKRHIIKHNHGPAQTWTQTPIVIGPRERADAP